VLSFIHIPSDPGKITTLITLVLVVLPLTLLISCISYSVLEKPGVALGHKLANSPKPMAKERMLPDVAVDRK
jgi:peptidoglycan/LPS O-acetylase OafA/YrhL